MNYFYIRRELIQVFKTMQMFGCWAQRESGITRPINMLKMEGLPWLTNSYHTNFDQIKPLLVLLLFFLKQGQEHTGLIDALFISDKITSRFHCPCNNPFLLSFSSGWVLLMPISFTLRTNAIWKSDQKQNYCYTACFACGDSALIKALSDATWQ